MQKILLVFLLVTMFQVTGFAGETDKIYTDFSEHFKIYPNPSTDGYITLKFDPRPEIEIDYTVYSMIGEVIIHGKLNGLLTDKVKLDLSSQPQGTYFIRLSDGKKRITKRITLKN